MQEIVPAANAVGAQQVTQSVQAATPRPKSTMPDLCSRNAASGASAQPEFVVSTSCDESDTERERVVIVAVGV